MNGIIYKWTSPEGKSYIGQTVDEKKRIAEHRQCAGGLKLFYAAIKKYGWINFSYEVLHSDVSSHEELDGLEKKYIQEHGTLSPNGYNVLLGGRDAFRYHRPKGVKRSVVNVTTGEIFESLKDACKKTGLDSGNISTCCSGKKKSLGGFVWKYADEYSPGEIAVITDAKVKKIKCKTTGEIFNSMSDAARKYGIPHSKISDCCHGKIKQTKKMEFEFYKENS